MARQIIVAFSRLFSVAMSVTVLAACSAEDKPLIFGTRSVVGLDVTTTANTPAATFGWERGEGFITFDRRNRSAHSVLAGIKGDFSGWTSAKFDSVYATGYAATRLAAHDAFDCSRGMRPSAIANVPEAPQAERSPTIFSTTTIFGVRVGGNTTQGSFNVGYKRDELAFIPMSNFDGGVPSLLAALQGNTAATGANGGTAVAQIFATAEAAESIACDPATRDQLRKILGAAPATGQKPGLTQFRARTALADLQACLLRVDKVDDETKRKSFIAAAAGDANTRSLGDATASVGAATDAAQAFGNYSAIVLPKIVEAVEAVKTKEEAMDVPGAIAALAPLEGHRSTVCQMAEKATPTPEADDSLDAVEMAHGASVCLHRRELSGNSLAMVVNQLKSVDIAAAGRLSNCAPGASAAACRTSVGAELIALVSKAAPSGETASTKSLRLRQATVTSRLMRDLACGLPPS